MTEINPTITLSSKDQDPDIVLHKGNRGVRLVYKDDKLVTQKISITETERSKFSILHFIKAVKGMFIEKWTSYEIQILEEK